MDKNRTTPESVDASGIVNVRVATHTELIEHSKEGWYCVDVEIVRHPLLHVELDPAFALEHLGAVFGPPNTKRDQFPRFQDIKHHHRNVWANKSDPDWEYILVADEPAKSVGEHLLAAVKSFIQK